MFLCPFCDFGVLFCGNMPLYQKMIYFVKYGTQTNRLFDSIIILQYRTKNIKMLEKKHNMCYNNIYAIIDIDLTQQDI